MQFYLLICILINFLGCDSHIAAIVIMQKLKVHPKSKDQKGMTECIRKRQSNHQSVAVIHIPNVWSNYSQINHE